MYILITPTAWVIWYIYKAISASADAYSDSSVLISTFSSFYFFFELNFDYYYGFLF